jgi:hypothetical protein
MKDYKKAAAGDFDEDVGLPPIKPEAHERREIVKVLRPAQITAYVERKVLRLTPSDKNWISVMRRIFGEGRI